MRSRGQPWVAFPHETLEVCWDLKVGWQQVQAPESDVGVYALEVHRQYMLALWRDDAHQLHVRRDRRDGLVLVLPRRFVIVANKEIVHIKECRSVRKLVVPLRRWVGVFEVV